MKIAIIADDLTGANDSGVQLAKAGLDTVVWLNGKGSSENRAEAVVVDTDSRALSPKEAKAAVHAAMSALAPYNPNLIFKKSIRHCAAMSGQNSKQLPKLGSRNAFC